MFKIKINDDPYGEGFRVTLADAVSLPEGVTILVGCNGAGKTTMLQTIKEQARKEDIPTLLFDNKQENEHKYYENFMYSNQMSKMATMFLSSEGEQIGFKIGELCRKIYTFLKTGKYSNGSCFDTAFEVFRKEQEKDASVSNKRFILLDAVDSGFSIDNMDEVKGVFNMMIEDAKQMGLELYIVVSTNSYEFARNMNCLDVIRGEFRTFKDYEDYREFIIDSSKLKSERFKE